MMIIPEDLTEIQGIVRTNKKNRVEIEFPDKNKKITIPSYFVHNSKLELNKRQMLKIETWILKKKHIIPKYSPEEII